VDVAVLTTVCLLVCNTEGRMRHLEYTRLSETERCEGLYDHKDITVQVLYSCIWSVLWKGSLQ